MTKPFAQMTDEELESIMLFSDMFTKEAMDGIDEEFEKRGLWEDFNAKYG